jgi:protein SCO1/2
MRQRLLNITLRTEHNQPVRFYDDLVKGKVVVISFMFTECQNVCPRTTAVMRKVQEALGERVGKDVFLYSISLDAEHDTPEVLLRYAQAAGAKAGWSFLTGKREEIEQLRRNLGMYDPDPAVDADKTQHGGFLVVGDEPVGRWLMMPALVTPEKIVPEIQRMLAGDKVRASR